MGTRGYMLQSNAVTTGKGSGSMSWFITELVLHAQTKNTKTQFEQQIFKPGVQQMESTSLENSILCPPNGNRYTLTAVCMLTGFTICILLRVKQQRTLKQHGEIIFLSHLVSAGNYSLIMG